MPTDTKLQNLIINDLTEEQYKALTPNENELYLTPNIDLYNHAIYITGRDNVGSIDFYLNVISSKNLNVKNIDDLKTLLGDTFERVGNGSYGDATLLIAITQDGLIQGNTEMVSFASLTNVTFKDTVTTI